MHSFVGLAAVAIALATVLHTGEAYSTIARIELFIGCFIGAITFSASVFAFGKLGGKMGEDRRWWLGEARAGIAIYCHACVWGHLFCADNLMAFYVMTLLAVVFGWMWIAPIGGGDMPVVVSL